MTYQETTEKLASVTGAEVGVRIYRGATAEAVHYASIAVVNAKGVVTHSLGDPSFLTMTRSSIKPFQLTPLVVTGAADFYKYSNEQLSIMAGSHSGTDAHRMVVLSNLDRAGNTHKMLKCGCHVPIFMQNDGVFPRADEDKDPLRHNCSGKHSGFLALAKFLNVPLDEYLEPNSRSQLLVRKALSECCDFPEDQMALGIDGCSAPNFPLPLRNLAFGFMRLANPQGSGLRDEVVKALDRIRAAMTEHPFMFSGEKRLDLALMQSFPGNVICKGGAEALQAIGFRDPQIGIVVKVHDGNPRAIGTIVVETLKQLGMIRHIEDHPELERFQRPEIRNYRQIVTGHMVSEFSLRKA